MGRMFWRSDDPVAGVGRLEDRPLAIRQAGIAIAVVEDRAARERSGSYLRKTVRRSPAPRHGSVPWDIASVKTIAVPAGPVTGPTGPRRIASSSFQASGNGKFALWLPGTPANPPSPGLTSRRL